MTLNAIILFIIFYTSLFSFRWYCNAVHSCNLYCRYKLKISKVTNLTCIIRTCEVFFKKKFNVYLFSRERQSESRLGAERQGDRICSRLQALSCQHRALHWARAHRRWDHELRWSQMLNQWATQVPLTCEF